MESRRALLGMSALVTGGARNIGFEIAKANPKDKNNIATPISKALIELGNLIKINTNPVTAITHTKIACKAKIPYSCNLDII